MEGGRGGSSNREERRVPVFTIDPDRFAVLLGGPTP